MPESKGAKQVLAQALKSLMSRYPFSKISVGDICKECHMSRKSFYYHFQDKYDLVNWIFDSEFIGTLQLSNLSDDWQLLFSLCAYFHRERVFYRNALQIRGQNCFQDYFIETIRPFISILISDVYVADDHLDFYVTFYTDAFLSALIRWLNEGAVVPPDQFAALLKNAMQGLSRSPDDDFTS